MFLMFFVFVFFKHLANAALAFKKEGVFQ